MAWTAPRTWVTNEVVTAAIMNTHVRDNLLETSAATVTTAGDLAYADAANSMGSRVAVGAAGSLLVADGTAPRWGQAVRGFGNTTEISSTTSTTYAPLDDAKWSGTAITATATTGTHALTMIRASVSNDTATHTTHMAWSISGATTSAASDAQSIFSTSTSGGDVANFGSAFLNTGLTAGSNTWELESKVSGGTGRLRWTELIIIPLS